MFGYLKTFQFNFLLATYIFLCSYSVSGQNKNIVAEGLVLEDFQKDLIATNKYVTDLFQDSNGFIWMGSFYGVNVYDGTNFFFYKDHLDNNNGFKGYRVRNILESNTHQILVVMRNSGINVFNPVTGKFKNYNESILKDAKNDIVQNACESKSGHLYITTSKEIVIAKFDENENLVKHKIIGVELNKNEYLRKGVFFNEHFLVETNQRILKINDTENTTVFKERNIRQLFVKYGELWVLANQKIGRLNIDTNFVNWLNYTMPKEEVYITDFEFASKNLLFVGTRKGCFKLDLSSGYHVVSSKKLNIDGANGVIEIYTDKVNNLYFSLTGVNGGIKKMNINQLNYQYIKLPKTEKEYFFDAFLSDSEGLYWSGSRNGVFAYNTKTDSFLKFSNDSIAGLDGVKILDIIEVNKVVWINTDKGLAEYNRGENNFKIYRNQQGTSFNPVNNLCVNNSDLWFVTKKGVARFNTSTKETTYFNIRNLVNSSKEDKIYSDLFDVKEPSAINIENNTLWVNVQTKGLFSFDISSQVPKLLHRYQEEFSTFFHLSIYSPVRAINFDHLNRLWLSGVNGIYVYDYKKRKIIKHINKSNSLHLDNLYRPLKDVNGNFWIKQPKAPAICIDANSLEVIEKTPNWMYLPTKIGKREFNSGPTYQDDSSQIFVNGVNGYIVYHPNKLELDKIPPRVVLTNVEVNGKSRYSNFIGSQELLLPDLEYDENSVLVNLKNISHDNSPLKEFAYRLIGVSDEWIYTKTLDPLNYIGLQPNAYRLEVKSTNDGKLWSSIITLATFNIHSPWWKTSFAYFIYVLLFVAIIYAFYKIQLNKKIAVTEANQLKQLDDFKNKFYQNITHEFRTPLTVIIGMADNIEAKAYQMIKRNSEQLLNLVNELLEIGKIESNSTNLELTLKDIVEFTKYSMVSLESLAKDKEISLEFNAEPNSILMEFDVDKMQLVLNNLLSNAIKFTPNKGLVKVSVETKNEIVEIKVSDSGNGVSEENLEKIFDRYFQEKGSKSNTGTGLGLALSREIIQLMDGSIRAYNNKDRGVSFVVSLPIIKDLSKGEDNYHIEEQRQISYLTENKENIVLVIEDNKDVLTYISSVLEPFYKVCTAANGKLGVEKAIELIPDLIISDVMMPIMDGYEVCHSVKSDFRTNHIPVIMLTAKADLNSKLSGLKLGADVYLGKPFHKDELLTHITSLILVRENLKKKYSEGNSIDNAKPKEFSNKFLMKINEVLLNNISDDTFGIIEICKEIGVSRTQLHRKLKALTGLSTSKFISDTRLNEGYKLLKESDLTIAEIAYSIGFKNPNYFSTLFAEKFKTPPSKVDR